MTDQLSTRTAVPSCHSDAGGRAAAPGAPVVALAGSPNVGKSTLFNALTGAKRQMGNWPGTSVEVGRGSWVLGDADVAEVALIDLPGAYSLDPASPDEELTRDLLIGAPPDERPDLVIVTVDAAHLARSLYLVAQVREHALRVVVALTMADIAARRGIHVDAHALAAQLGAQVVDVDPRHRSGRAALGEVVAETLRQPVPVPRPLSEIDVLGEPSLQASSARPTGSARPVGSARPTGPAHPADSLDTLDGPATSDGPVTPDDPVTSDGPVTTDDLDAELWLADSRFAWVDQAVRAASRTEATGRSTWSDRIDAVVTSRLWGPLVFLAAMWLVFQVTTTVAAPLQDALDSFVTGPVSDGARRLLGLVGLGGTPVEGFVVDGLIAGVGMLLTFAPLMALMFLLLALLEDSGYLARAAVVTDRLMRSIGLPGRAFLPLVVGFGCNVPAISATRTLPNARHRIMTALLVPLTSCSARLTVYVLMATTFFPSQAGTVVFAMYVLSIVLVVLLGLALRATLWRRVGDEPLILDLPPYQRPHLRLMADQTWVRLRTFLQTAGGIIVATVTIVWLLQATPAGPGHGSFGDVPAEDSAYAATAMAVAPVFEPAGFGEWRTSSALVVGFVAKEAVVSSWAQTFAVSEPSSSDQPGRLGDLVRADFERSSGGHGAVAALAFMVFLLAYTPCVATVATQRREIGLRWTLFGIAVQLAMAWTLAVLVFQVGRVFW